LLYGTDCRGAVSTKAYVRIAMSASSGLQDREHLALGDDVVETDKN
jgi:hypothetical protein